MKFFDKLNLRRFAKVAAVATLGGTLFFADTPTANADSAGMQAFREAYLTQIKNMRMIDQDLTLISPNFHLDVDSKAQIGADGTFMMSGELDWTYTNLKKNYSTNNRIPFYIEQAGAGELKIYVRRLGRWSYMTLPGLPVGLVSFLKTTDMSMLSANVDAVKDVEIIKDTDNMRVMKVTLDGKKIAAILEKNAEAAFAKLSGDELAQQREILKRWTTAIGSEDQVFNWTVNKPDFESVTAVFDLTNIMRAYCRYVLDESAAGNVVLTDEERDLLDAMGYYAELRSYTSRIEPRKDIYIVFPSELNSATENDHALDDIFYEMTTVVQK